MPCTSRSLSLTQLQVPTLIDFAIIPALVFSTKQWGKLLVRLLNSISLTVTNNLDTLSMTSLF